MYRSTVCCAWSIHGIVYIKTDESSLQVLRKNVAHRIDAYRIDGWLHYI